jgi:hypothetical protein
MQDVGLHRSVQRHLEQGEQAQHVAHMFTRHYLAFPFIAAAGGALFVVAMFSGADQWATRISLGLAGAAVAAMATTEYRVLAQTTRGLVLLRSSRFRRRASGVLRRLANGTQIEVLGSNLVITEYRVDGVVYSVMRRSQQEMTAIADRR